MGRVLEMSPSPLDAELGPPLRYVVPTLPWDLSIEWSPEVLAALSDASRAIGRLEGAHRVAHCGLDSQSAMASIEAWSCVLVAGMKARWAHVAREFAEEDLRWVLPSTGAETVSTLLGFHLRLEGYGAAKGCEGAVSNKYFDGIVVSPHVRNSLWKGLPTWLESSSRSDSSLLRCVLSIMYIAASCPESPEVGVAARTLFPWLLQSTHGANAFVPISLGFVEFPDEWAKVAGALAVSGEDDSVVVNEGVLCALRAVERAAVCAAFEVEEVKRELRWYLESAKCAWLRAVRPSVAYVFRVVYGLPSVTRQNLEALTGFSTRTVNTAVRMLVEHDMVTLTGKVWGAADYSVRPMQLRYPRVSAASFYPSVSAAPEESR